ncbi:MAG: hypothetical protein IPK13_24475 [Deltaproteobacteria bacterium]|nr:hypothetical protein [Deltaproteobacteria bacterium]
MRTPNVQKAIVHRHAGEKGRIFEACARVKASTNGKEKLKAIVDALSRDLSGQAKSGIPEALQTGPVKKILARLETLHASERLRLLGKISKL